MSSSSSIFCNRTKVRTQRDEIWQQVWGGCPWDGEEMARSSKVRFHWFQFDVDHTDDPSYDDAISDADYDEKRWCALLGLVTNDPNWFLFLILIMPMIQVILVTLKLMMMQIILILFWWLKWWQQFLLVIWESVQKIKEFSKPCTWWLMISSFASWMQGLRHPFLEQWKSDGLTKFLSGSHFYFHTHYTGYNDKSPWKIKTCIFTFIQQSYVYPLHDNNQVPLRFTERG